MRGVLGTSRGPGVAYYCASRMGGAPGVNWDASTRTPKQGAPRNTPNSHFLAPSGSDAFPGFSFQAQSGL